MDNFKEVNDALGHLAGDQLLRSAGERLRQAVRKTDTVARYGGDEFAILGEDLRNEGGAAERAKAFLALFARPFILDGAECLLTPSIGVAITGDATAEPLDLLAEADAAMYRVRAASVPVSIRSATG
ncbi:MAG: diguanylate cyclase domain-containing protein [Acidimicrobiales bacterium]